MGTTIHDVARRAGVSISTVSRVLNQTVPVSDENRQRVLEAVEALGYKPNPVARSLLKRETGIIGVLLPFISGEFFAELLHGIDQSIQQNDYILMVSASHRHATEFRAALRGMYRRVDGFLIMAPEMAGEAVLDQLSDDVPVVFINTHLQSDTFDVFNFDNYGGMYAVTQHLLDLGHRRIAFIKGTEEAHDAQTRLQGYRDAIKDCGGELNPAFELGGDFSALKGYEAALSILQDDPRPTAIVAANDESAQGALRGLLKAGIRVPQDIALAGFDDIPSSRFVTPSLSTVRVPIREIAVQAIERLIARIKGKNSSPGIQHALPLDLIIRESTGRAD